MRLSLNPHPDFPCTAVDRITVGLARAEALTLHYVVTGRIDRILLPALSTPARTDELWKRTCFEAFMRPTPGEAYLEFNFAPSTQWAAYRFSAYRSDMQPAAEVAPPHIETSASADRYELRASVLIPAAANVRLGLSAIVEQIDGAKSYWALAHGAGQPDFHHDDSFAYDLC